MLVFYLTILFKQDSYQLLTYELMRTNEQTKAKQMETRGKGGGAHGTLADFNTIKLGPRGVGGKPAMNLGSTRASPIYDFNRYRDFLSFWYRYHTLKRNLALEVQIGQVISDRFSTKSSQYRIREGSAVSSQIWYQYRIGSIRFRRKIGRDPILCDRIASASGNSDNIRLDI